MKVKPFPAPKAPLIAAVFSALLSMHTSSIAGGQCLPDSLNTSVLDNGFLSCMLTCLPAVPNTFACLAQDDICSAFCSGNNDNPCTAGNPINLYTGAKLEVVTDYNGPGPDPLTIRRHYSTSNVFTEGNFGNKWRGSNERFITVITEQFTAPRWPLV